MKNVRIIYTKTDRMKFVSHLDMNRFFLRLFRMAEVPIWYTEGFHQHPYISFALPLSLGFESEYEVVDFKMTDDEYSFDRLLSSLNEHTVPGIRFLECFEQQKKTKEIANSVYEITCPDDKQLQALALFLNRPSILAEKRNKKGQLNQIELTDFIRKKEILDRAILLTLPSGMDYSINPQLFLTAFRNESEYQAPFRILRKAILDHEGELFR